MQPINSSSFSHFSLRLFFFLLDWLILRFWCFRLSWHSCGDRVSSYFLLKPIFHFSSMLCLKSLHFEPILGPGMRVKRLVAVEMHIVYPNKNIWLRSLDVTSMRGKLFPKNGIFAIPLKKFIELSIIENFNSEMIFFNFSFAFLAVSSWSFSGFDQNFMVTCL